MTINILLSFQDRACLKTQLFLAEILCDSGNMKTYRKWFFSEERAFYLLNQSIVSMWCSDGTRNGDIFLDFNTELLIFSNMCRRHYRKWSYIESWTEARLNQCKRKSNTAQSSRYKDFSWQKYLYRCDLGITKTYRKCFFSEERTFYHNESEWLIPKRAAKFARQVRSENDTWSLTGWENGGMTDYPILKHRMPFCAKWTSLKSKFAMD